MTETDPFDLARFIKAQAAVYPGVLEELRRGAKSSHWMWFIFPQLRGLGRSETARRFGIASIEETRAYLAHPVLGARLRECVALMNAVEGKSAFEILGPPDDLKFRSCLTLFSIAAPEESVFSEALRRYFAGSPDPATLDLLGQTPAAT